MTDWPRTWRTATFGRACPACGERSGRPILRGMPSNDVFQALERGEISIVVGGCCVAEDDPSHECTRCGTRFGSSRGQIIDDSDGQKAT